MRILLSEGSSTSAREAVTAFGLRGHEVEICDPDPHCFARFSRFVKKYHRCPGLRDHPLQYLDFVIGLVSRERFDVLVPIHEQGYLFAAARERLSPHVALALPSFASYRIAHSKAGFHGLLKELGLPQPPTTIVKSPQELRQAAHYPCVVKAAIGTASRGTFLVHSPADLAAATEALAADGAFHNPVLVQGFVDGDVEHTQAVFHGGDLVAMHACRQVARGAGGGDAIKESVSRPLVGEHLRAMGRALDWHGAWSLDYILTSGGPCYIDSNPRLVEPMGSQLCGVDLAGLLLEISLGERPRALQPGRDGIRTHLSMQALLGAADRGASRAGILAESRHLIAKNGPYRGSWEELTPVRLDWMSAGPLLATAVILLTNPAWGEGLAKEGWGSHLLSPETIGTIGEHFASNRTAT
jgi:predicted ATP-grasp superfamily ATP-dependent carboligase